MSVEGQPRRSGGVPAVPPPRPARLTPVQALIAVFTPSRSHPAIRGTPAGTPAVRDPGYHPASPLLAGEDGNSRRAFYRVTYPIPARPRFAVGDDRFAVIDCSELGLRYEAPSGHEPEVGSHGRGLLMLRSGGEHEIGYQVVRSQDRTVGVWFDHGGIPFGEIVAEQQWLRVHGYVLGEGSE